MSVAYVDIRLFTHATEIREKVVAAALHLVPPELREEVAFKEQKLRGHHGNPIILLEARIRSGEAAQAVAENMVESLSEADRERLAVDLEKHWHKQSLIIKLDKQAAYRGKTRLHSTDPIHVKIRFKKSRLDPEKTLLELGILR